jgi:predicted NBD/HSP70 family sugar kinase
MSDVAIGVDVGGTKALALMVARDGRVLDEVQVATPHDESTGAGEATAVALTEQINELCDRHGYDASKFPVGIGLPGLGATRRSIGVRAELAKRLRGRPGRPAQQVVQQRGGVL